MSEWEATNLGSVCSDISYGYTESASQEPVGPKFLRITDIVPKQIDWGSVPFCKADADTFDKYKLKNGDIVIARTGATTGYNKTIKNLSHDAVYASYLIRYQIDEKKAYPYFVGHILQSSDWYGYVEAIAGGSAQPGANAKLLGSFEFLLPPIPEQKAIASVLSSLDDKIDLLHRQNKTLEAMAKTLFRQWFVEEAQEDWETGTIAELIEFNPTRKLAKGTVAPYLEMAALSTTMFSPEGWYDREFTSGTKFVNGDTLLARITPCLENGKTAYITFLDDTEVAWGSTEYIVMRPNKELHSFFAYTLARNSDFREYAEGCMEGSSGRQRVNVDHLKNYSIKIPSIEVIGAFNSFAESTARKLHENAAQMRTLEKLRDTLLPKLISGEVRVAV
jgi:type I restriction enzyme, S subunit